MSEAISSNKAIAKNTLFLYGRMLFNLVVSLYTSRVILKILGIEDLGTYQVVAGIVALFSFIQSALSGATSRFLSFELGRGDYYRLQKTFSAALSVHIIAALIFLFLCETIGLWVVLYKLVLPEERVNAALIVYHSSVLMAVLSLCQVPYNASIIAHEKMDIFAYIGILDTFLKLIACYFVYISFFDKLATYGVVLLFFSFAIQSLYWIYCRRNFQECHFTFRNKMKIIKPILIFSGWDLFGNVSFVLKQQGVNIIQNLFFGVVVNAAIGFSNSIYAAVSSFIGNFMMSIRPSITKAYANGDYQRMQQLMIDGGKFSFCLLLLMATPFFFESDYIIHLWLSNPPKYTSVFCKLQLFTCIIGIMTQPVTFGIKATGRIKTMSLFDSLMMLLILPLSYYFLKVGYGPIVPYIIMIIVEFVKSNVYAYLLKKEMNDFNIGRLYYECILPCILLFAISMLATYFVHSFFFENHLFKLLFTILFSTLFICSITWAIILDQSKRALIKYFIKNKLQK